MKPTNGRTTLLAKLSLAAGLLGATALGAATAAPLGPQASLQPEEGLIAQVKHKHHRRWPGVGAVIVLGAAGYCTVEAATCAEQYGQGSWRYWRCMRRAGCDW